MTDLVNNSKEDDPQQPLPHSVSMKPANASAPGMTVRARRRREEAVRRLVADIQSKTDKSLDGDIVAMTETHDWLVASTVAAALEKGLDRDLHAELVQEAKDNAGRIGQVCHDHADVFLASVAQVAALGEPSADLADGLKENQRELATNTAGPMHVANVQWEQAGQAYARGKTLHIMVVACQRVAIQLERARKQAALGRPRAALDAVDQARTALTIPIESLFEGKDRDLYKATTLMSKQQRKSALSGDNLNVENEEEKMSASNSNLAADNANNTGAATTNLSTINSKEKLVNLEQTPFGTRASIMLPKIENEVLMSARRGLNRWFLSLRSGGEAAMAGRAVVRQCSFSLAMGPGNLGMGGTLPPAHIWRAKTADNLLSRVDQGGKVARAVRAGYFFDRDAPKEADRIEKMTEEGQERRAEAIASAFGFYRCWMESSTLLVDPQEVAADFGAGVSLSGSRHGSRHGGSAAGSTTSGGSRHGLRGSRHGKTRSLGFRATTNSRSQAFQEITATLGSATVKTNLSQRTPWCEFLIPEILNDKASTRKDDDQILNSLPESVHAVRRAELAFTLLGKAEEFVTYYESNRFGETKIESDKKSYLSALTGDDVSQGTDRVFFAKTFPHLCASVAGFCAVEAALELSDFADDDDDFLLSAPTNNSKTNGSSNAAGTTSTSNKPSMKSGGFREASERYERALISELGALFRSRAIKANFGELVRSSVLLSVLRASLKVCHPSSSTRRFDKDLLAVDKNILLTALKLGQDEQLKATTAIVSDDSKVPMLVADAPYSNELNKKGAAGVPDPEVCGLPFGLSQMIQTPQKAELDFQDRARTSYNRAAMDEAYTFSACIPEVVRSIHSRAIACAAFALSQEELGQAFPEKNCSPSAGYVLDFVEGCVNVTAIGLKDSNSIVDEGSVEKAVQVMANISALQHCLPRFYATLMRGLCHVGLIRADEVEATLAYAEQSLKLADKSCDAQVGSTYSLIYEICRNKIDSHINLALENFQWVAKTIRETPNAYCEGLIGYLKAVFASLGPMDEGSRAGLHLSCCQHISERLVKLLSGRPGDTASYDDSGLPPVTRIDAFGLKNLNLDCEEFERFADSTGVPQLRDCFIELRVLTSVMLDKELPMLMLPENAASRRRKYPILSFEKVINILEKYQGTGLGDKLMGGARNYDFLFIEKKEVAQLIKIARGQLR